MLRCSNRPGQGRNQGRTLVDEAGVNLQQGGPVGGQLGEGQPLERRTLMGDAGQDGRIQAPDVYIVKGDRMSRGREEVNAIPKLSTAYLAAFGFETPFSKRQNALIKMKMIEPERLSAQTKGLIGRALIQRLAKEPN